MIKCEFEGHCMEMHLSFYVMSCFNVVVGLIGPQIPPGRMDPMHNNAPLQFNTNKGKPPMALEGDPGIAEYIRIKLTKTLHGNRKCFLKKRVILNLFQTK